MLLLLAICSMTFYVSFQNFYTSAIRPSPSALPSASLGQVLFNGGFIYQRQKCSQGRRRMFALDPPKAVNALIGIPNPRRRRGSSYHYLEGRKETRLQIFPSQRCK